MYTVHRLLWLPASKRRSHQCYHLCKSVRNPFCVCPSVTLLDSHSCRPNSSNRVHCDSFRNHSECVRKHLIVGQCLLPIRASKVACQPLVDPRLFLICLSFNADSQTSRFCTIPKLENFLNHKAKHYILNRVTFVNKDLQFLEGLEEFFRGNSRI